MSNEKHFPESLVQYSDIKSSTVKPDILVHTAALLPNKSKNSIQNLPFNKQLASKNDRKIISEQIEIVNQILPPREYYDSEKKVYYVQYASLTPATRTDVYNLNDKLNFNLKKYEARNIGLCAVRRKYFKECFDEIIRQVSIECIERGIILSRIKDELNQTIDTYKLLYTSATAFGMRKILLNEDKSKNLCQDIEKYKLEINNLNKKLDEEKMLRIQAERQLVEQDSIHKDKIKELNNAHSLVIHDLRSQILQFTSKTFLQLKN